MRALRWLLLLPGAILALMIGSLTGGIIAGTFGQAAADTGSAFAGPFAFVFAACWIAPAYRRTVGLAAASVMATLAVGTVILSSFTTIPEFATLSARDKLVTPVAQILGALYALFICLPALTAGTTQESILREIIALAVVVIMLGALIAIIGLAAGLVGFGWLGLKVGMGVLLLGLATWMFPFGYIAARFKT